MITWARDRVLVEWCPDGRTSRPTWFPRHDVEPCLNWIGCRADRRRAVTELIERSRAPRPLAEERAERTGRAAATGSVVAADEPRSRCPPATAV